ncbi:hypothetical protein OHA61_34075 [Streptomyces sp. NBC_00885]|uniref:hypothetical protein n=1 Tax=Streptomyces sp. NBC_00885 TaxID=2975857 RepID=UPI003864383F|nr:hypothetical protein OHA61_34075 [Streptomyces sp. NBC_00885]
MTTRKSSWERKLPKPFAAKYEALRCGFCDALAETGRHDKSCVMRSSSDARPVETDDDDQLPYFKSGD